MRSTRTQEGEQNTGKRLETQQEHRNYTYNEHSDRTMTVTQRGEVQRDTYNFWIPFELCHESHIWRVSVWRIIFQLRKVTVCHKVNEDSCGFLSWERTLKTILALSMHVFILHMQALRSVLNLKSGCSECHHRHDWPCALSALAFCWVQKEKRSNNFQYCSWMTCRRQFLWPQKICLSNWADEWAGLVWL